MTTTAAPVDDTPPFDAEAFAADLDALRKRVLSELGPDDLAHLRKIERWARGCSALGYATAWIAPNPVSVLLISTGRVARWTMIAHHVSHRGYDRVPGTPPRRTSERFAHGWRRVVDWLDWIDPGAWAHEHNQLHHYKLSEQEDPDLVERNLAWLREGSLPRPLRLAVVGFFAGTWKWSYYAPNTLESYERDQRRKRREDPGPQRTLPQMFLDPAFWKRCLLPYATVNFGVIPALFLPLGTWAAGNVLVNSLLAEVVANVHSFVIITTNHAGDDLLVFDTPMGNKAEFYRRQVLGSTNFRTGGDLNDFLHGWLNYQIEHHLFPDLPMRQYQRIQPEVKALCEKHGLPYVQQSVFRRLAKTVAVMIGDETMPHEAPAAAPA